MQSNKNIHLKSAFSLVELLVVMGVISVLMSISVFGFTVMNRNSRNASRAKLASDIKFGFEEYYNRNGVYPNVDDVIYDTANKTITVCYDGVEGSVCTSGKSYIIKVEGDHLIPADQPTSERRSTAFCYAPTTRGNYVLGVKLEGQDIWKDVGNDEVGCTDTAMVWSASNVFIEEEIKLPTATPALKPKVTEVPKITKSPIATQVPTIKPTIRPKITAIPTLKPVSTVQINPKITTTIHPKVTKSTQPYNPDIYTR